jgi:hypothetical protein
MPICGQMASWLAPGHPAWREASSQACVWQFVLEPKVGGLPMEETQPSPTPGASNPRTRLLRHSIQETGIPPNPPLPLSLSFPADLAGGVRANHTHSL